MPVNDERNARARAQLVAALRSNQAFAFTGAGVSVWAGYGSWAAVLGRLAQRVVERCGNEVNADAVMQNYQNDPLLCAQKLGRYLGNVDFGDFIQAEFGPNGVSPHDVIYRLIGLPFRHFVTLNFDPSLEQGHQALARPCGSVSTADRRGVARFMREMDGSEYVRQVVHLHGAHFDAPDLIALTEQGYRRLYRDNRWYTNFLWLLTVSKRLVFMGFGFQDFGEWGFEEGSRRHLNEMIEIALKRNIISEDRLSHAVRNYRNLVHLGREIREGLQYTHDDAILARSAVGVIANELRRWYGRRGTAKTTSP